MLRKISTVLIVVFAFTCTSFGQAKYYLTPAGELVKGTDLEAQTVVPNKLNNPTMMPKSNPQNIFGADDTLEYRSTYSIFGAVNFGMFGYDWMVQWFVAPTTMNIKAVGVCTYENPDAANAEVKVVKLNLTPAEIRGASKLWGYYPAAGNGYNDITAFRDNEDRTGDWVAVEGRPEIFGEDIWSDGGIGAPIFPDPALYPNYQWIPMSLLGVEPEVQGDVVFGVAMKNVHATMDAARIGLLGFVNGTGLLPGLKFYVNGRFVPGPPSAGSDAGWWSRNDYMWDMVVAVELTGDIAPSISNVTNLPTTLDTGPRDVEATIIDINPSGGAFGVASAVLQYSTDNTTFTDINMTDMGGDIYKATLPGQTPKTQVWYKIVATDVNGNSSTSLTYSYRIYAPTEGVNTLLVFNGYSTVTGYPRAYYFGKDDFTTYETYGFEMDAWAYGPITAQLANFYTNIFEICTTGPKDYNDDVIKAWLEASGNHNYFLAGDEWLGARHDFTDMDFAAGTFEYDVLGVTHSYNDISYAGGTGSSLPTRVFPQQGSLLGGPLYDLFNTQPTDSMNYDPVYEIGVSNWIDGFDVADGIEADIKGESRGIGGEANVQVLNIGAHRTLSGGNKIVFLSYDPLSLNSRPAYYWYGFSATAPQVQAALWFDVALSVRKIDNQTPETFAISQNYPNPFNPTTTINFSVPQSSKVVLKVYDLLGKEVATLINEEKEAGNYAVNFEAANLASGLYIYTINAGSFSASKKMMLLK